MTIPTYTIIAGHPLVNYATVVAERSANMSTEWGAPPWAILSWEQQQERIARVLEHIAIQRAISTVPPSPATFNYINRD